LEHELLENSIGEEKKEEPLVVKVVHRKEVYQWKFPCKHRLDMRKGNSPLPPL